MRKASLLAVAALALLPTRSPAQVTVGLRAGYSIPTGDAANVAGFGSFKEKDLYAGLVPLQVEASWRITPALSAGLYWSYGFGTKGSQLDALVCSNASSCSGLYDMRLGAQAAWSFGPTGPVEPWIGLGAGWEAAHFEAKNASFPTGAPPPFDRTPPDELGGTLRGWELSLQGGVDWRATSALALGPFVQVQVGQCRVQDVTYLGPGTVPGNGGIPNAKAHEFITLGVRGKFDI
jgi:outer membrane protein